MGTRIILLTLALLFSSIVSAETIVPSDYMIAGKIGDTWVYENLDSTQFTQTLSQIASGPHAGRFKKGNIDSGLIYDLAGNVLTLYDNDMNPLDPPWVIGEIELGQVVERGDPLDPSIYLFWKVPSITVQAGTFYDVLAWVWLDYNFSANKVNVELGLNPLITAAVTDVNYFVPGFGEIRFRGVDALSGNSDSFGSELVSTTVKSPTCDIQISQATYTDGDTITADVFRIANLTSAQIASEWKVWLGVPGIPPISIFNLGADGSFVQPAGFDADFGPLPLVPVTAGLPRGSYELSCRMLDPVTGELLAEDRNFFEIQ